MPDLFVAADTSGYSVYYRNLVRRGIINSFALEYFDKNRNRLKTEYEDFEYFDKVFGFSPDEIKAFIEKGEREGVKFNELQFEISRDEILTVLKALIASNIWHTNEYFRILNKTDVVIKKAVSAVSDNSEYRRILGY